jgi:phage terminase large subunit-like protein
MSGPAVEDQAITKPEKVIKSFLSLLARAVSCQFRLWDCAYTSSKSSGCERYFLWSMLEKSYFFIACTQNKEIVEGLRCWS